jgi:hypothetical protein
MAKMDRPLKYDANQIMGVHGLKQNTKCDILNKLTSTKGVIEDLLIFKHFFRGQGKSVGKLVSVILIIVKQKRPQISNCKKL